jgi:hypothetical protein
MVVKLARYVDFIGVEESKNHSVAEIVKSIREFRAALDKFIQDPVAALERNIGNATSLAQDETNFIQRASYLNGQSQQLFNLFAKKVTCARVHAAQLHLSGFLTTEASFELLIKDCEREHWSSAECRWLEKLLDRGVIAIV